MSLNSAQKPSNRSRSAGGVSAGLLWATALTSLLLAGLSGFAGW